MSTARMLSVANAIVQAKVFQTEIEDKVFELFSAIKNARETPNACDHLLLGAANRSHGMLDAFEHLLGQNQLVVAVPLVRMQLDSLLRLYALSLTNDPVDLATKVFSGIRLGSLRDRNNNKLSDHHLHTTFATEYGEPTVTMVYQDTSGFVHLSDKHMTAALKSQPDGTYQILMTGEIGDPQQTSELAANSFAGITETLKNLFDRYVANRGL